MHMNVFLGKSGPRTKAISILLVLIIALGMFTTTMPVYAASVATYSDIPGYPVSSTVSVTANGTPITVQNNVDGVPFARFAMSGPVTVAVTVPSGLSTATIRPIALGINYTVSNNMLTFTLYNPQNLRIDLNNVANSFYLFADPLEVSPPHLGDANVKNVMDFSGVSNTGTLCTSAIQSAIDWVSANYTAKNILYFPDGTYMTGTLAIKSNVQIYLSSGAKIQGSSNASDYTEVYDFPPDQPHERAFITMMGVNNVKLFGRGIIDSNGRNFGSGGGAFGGSKVITVYSGVNSSRVGSSNLTIDDIMLANGWYYQWFFCGASNSNFTNIKAFNTCANGSNVCNVDAFKIMCGSGLNLNGAFFVANDDVLTTGADGPQADGDLYNCTINNVICDQVVTASSIYRVAFTNRFAVHDITLSNILTCDNWMSPHSVIKAENFPGYNYNHPIYNMTFKNWIVEGAHNLLSWGIGDDNAFSNFDNWKFVNMTVTRTSGSATLKGTSANHKVTNFTFQNLKINGSYCNTAASANISVDANTTSNITFDVLPPQAFSDNFSNDSGNWTTYNGNWSITNGRYCVTNTGNWDGPKAIAKTTSNYGDFTYEGDVSVASGGDAGLLFRASNISGGNGNQNAYLATINAGSSTLMLGKFVNNVWNQISSASVSMTPNTIYHLKVVASGSNIKVYLIDMNTPKINVTDTTYKSGQFGFRTWQADANFDNITMSPSTSGTATFYQDINYGGYAVTLGVGNYTLGALMAAGISNDDISSLKVNGRTVELYWDDNFGGSKLVKTADDSSLVDDGWNDVVSSLKIY